MKLLAGVVGLLIISGVSYFTKIYIIANKLAEKYSAKELEMMYDEARNDEDLRVRIGAFVYKVAMSISSRTEGE